MEAGTKEKGKTQDVNGKCMEMAGIMFLAEVDGVRSA